MVSIQQSKEQQENVSTCIGGYSEHYHQFQELNARSVFFEVLAWFLLDWCRTRVHRGPPKACARSCSVPVRLHAFALTEDMGSDIWPWLSKPMGSYFGVGAPLMFVYFSGDWDVHWGYGSLTHGHIVKEHTEQHPTSNSGTSLHGSTAQLTCLRARQPQQLWGVHGFVATQLMIWV